jgi:hypothetical protein
LKHLKSEAWTMVGAVAVVLVFFAAVVWCSLAWERWKAGIYADEFQKRGMAPQAVPK